MIKRSVIVDVIIAYLNTNLLFDGDPYTIKKNNITAPTSKDLPQINVNLENSLSFEKMSHDEQTYICESAITLDLYLRHKKSSDMIALLEQSVGDIIDSITNISFDTVHLMLNDRVDWLTVEQVLIDNNLDAISKSNYNTATIELKFNHKVNFG